MAEQLSSLTRPACANLLPPKPTAEIYGAGFQKSPNCKANVRMPIAPTRLKKAARFWRPSSVAKFIRAGTAHMCGYTRRCRTEALGVGPCALGRNFVFLLRSGEFHRRRMFLASGITALDAA